MEAIWNLEDKLKLSTQAVVIFFAATVFLVVAVVGLCAATALGKKARMNIQDRGVVVEPGEVNGSMGQCLRWSKASKWEGNLSASRKEQPTPLLSTGGGEVGWPSHNATSPVWQRPILMGGKCEFPRFSGLILYDESGKPLDQGHSVVDIQEQQPTVTATFRDLV
ncbi:uncharacterized protein [Rutidosis leptorrhynchoides]|uniref:uncharacterized protein n=1 Tax=Rutidosis leptorrhynchoides TaxID=125765 RepID=UPI003A9A41C6